MTETRQRLMFIGSYDESDAKVHALFVRIGDCSRIPANMHLSISLIAIQAVSALDSCRIASI